MLGSERTFKIKDISTVFEISFTSAIICIWRLFMEKRLSNIFKTTNVRKMTKAILKSSYRVLKAASKWLHLFLRAVEFWPTFDIQISITLAIFWEKLHKNTFWKAHRSLSKHANIHINRDTHYEITALFKNLLFFRLSSK